MRIASFLALACALLLPAPVRAQQTVPIVWAIPAVDSRLIPPVPDTPIAFDPPEMSGGQTALMVAGGTLGSALGLLSGFVAAAAVKLAATGCIGCPHKAGVVDYLLLGAGSSLGTGLVVAAMATEPSGGGFWGGALETSRTPVFRPALIGAVAGIGTGAALGGLVRLVAPSDDPYDLVGYNIGQAAASVTAVRLWADRQR